MKIAVAMFWVVLTLPAWSQNAIRIDPARWNKLVQSAGL
jgi:hypothetical protein